MPQIVVWEYYNSLHSAITEEEFERAEALAEAEVKRLIGYARWKSLDPEAYYYDQLKDCICNTIDKMAEDQASGRGKGISSVSNDGYSETYTIQTAAQLRTELQDAIRGWLSGTGLAGAL